MEPFHKWNWAASRYYYYYYYATYFFSNYGRGAKFPPFAAFSRKMANSQTSLEYYK